MQIHIYKNGQNLGPYSLLELNNLIQKNYINGADLAWYEGLDKWVPLNSITDVEIALRKNPSPASVSVLENPYHPPRAAEIINDADMERTPKIWNPNAAANWSLLFTPVFGALLQAKNWKALNQQKNEKKSKIWAITSLIIVLLTISNPENNGKGILLILLIFWYFLSAKKQINYIKNNNIKYHKKSWLKPITIAFISLFFYGILIELINRVSSFFIFGD